MDYVIEHIIGLHVVDQSILAESTLTSKKISPAAANSASQKNSPNPVGRPRKEKVPPAPKKPRGRPPGKKSQQPEYVIIDVEHDDLGGPPSNTSPPTPTAKKSSAAPPTKAKTPPKKRKRVEEDVADPQLEMEATISSLRDQVDFLNKKVKLESAVSNKSLEDIKRLEMSHQKEIKLMEMRLAKKGEEVVENDQLKKKIRELEKKISSMPKLPPAPPAVRDIEQVSKCKLFHLLL